MNRLARRSALVAAEVALVVAAVALGFLGFRAVLDTTEGAAIDPELDPTAPGYEAFAQTSPTLAVLGRDADGALSWIAALSLATADGEGGAIFLVPAATLVLDFSTDLDTLAQFDAAGGAERTGELLANTLGMAMGEVVELDPARVAELARPVAPLTVANPDAADGFPAGELVLAADDIGPFL
ncbi:MAG TPA: hypothetical protein VFG94_00070, partial [Acidimicrobiales bacterium]|nr:hypothetical protein [Acidimicrobiales bacterium]